MRKPNYIFYIILLLLFTACGKDPNTSQDSGAVSFNIKLYRPATAYLTSYLSGNNICIDYGITTINAAVLNSAGATVTSVSWPCSAHEGIITGIPAGSKYAVRLNGIDSNNSITWRGEKSDIDIISGATAVAGTITVAYIGSDTTAPVVTSVNPTMSLFYLGGVPVTTPMTATFSEKMALSSINISTFTVSNGSTSVSGSVTYDPDTMKANFSPSGNLSYSTTYTASLTTNIEDMAGNKMASDYSWSFITENQPSVTPSAPTGVRAIAGSRQVTINWDAVSGATTYNIYWSTTTGDTKTTGTKITNVTSPYTHAGLTNGTNYYYVVTAENSFGEGSGSSQASATPTPPLTGDVTSITDTSATLNGSFTNPTDYTTTAWFEYGITTSYGSQTTPQPFTNAGTIYVHSDNTGLKQLTTYHFRIVTSNSTGTFYGDDKVFNTYATPTTLASGMDNAYGIAVDSANVYWFDSGTLKRISKNGGTVTTLVSESGDSIAVDSTSVYWTNHSNSSVKKVSIITGAATTLVSGISYSAYDIAVDSTSLYFRGNGYVGKVGITGGTVTTFAGDVKDSRIAVDSTSVYYSGIEVLNKKAINGGAVTTLASGLISGPYGIAVDSTSVYWTEPSGGSVKKVSLNGGVVTTLASGLNSPTNIVGYATNVYWVENGAIKKVGINGGVVTSITWGLSNSYSIAIDSISVYWTEPSAVKKVPK